MKSSLIRINLIFILLFSFIPNPASAETKTFIKEYTYQASEYDSKVTCRALALEQVKRLLLEELGTYLESQTEVENFQLTRDQIITLTAGIVMAQIIEEKWDGRSYWLKAKVSADTGEVSKSIDRLRKDRQKTKELEEMRKKADEALSELEKLREELKITKAEKKNFDQYNRAINKLSVTGLVERGHALFTSGKYQDAIEAYSKAIKLDPKNAELYDFRADTYRELHNLNRAIKDYDKEIELDPKNKKAYKSRAYTYTDLGEYGKAIIDYNHMIDMGKNNANEYHLRGLIYAELKEYQQAIRDYDRAIELKHKDDMIYRSRGSAYHELGNYKQAIEDYDKAIELSPKSSVNYYERGLVYIDIGNYNQSIKDFNKALEINSEYTASYNSRGRACARLGNYKQAIEDYNRAIKLNPKDASIYYYNRGCAHNALHRYKQAVMDFTKAIELKPNDEDSYYDRGLAYRQLGLNSKATGDIKIAARLGLKDAQDFLRSEGIDW